MPALLLLAITHAPAIAQEVPSCTQSAYRQFDFWVGEWDVVDTRGQPAGVNRIEKTLNGCALYETWTIAGTARGNSYSAWDAGDNRWHQTWVDNSGTVLRLSGGIVNGEMVMEGERSLMDGTSVTERITWTPNADGTVRQLWQSSRNRGMRWTVTFDGTYRRRQEDDPDSRFPIPDSQFPIPDSRFPILDPRSPIPDSRFPIPDSRFPIPDSRFPIQAIGSSSTSDPSRTAFVPSGACNSRAPSRRSPITRPGSGSRASRPAARSLRLNSSNSASDR